MHAQDNWANLLPLAQFVHNSWPSATTGLSPFKLLIGFTPSSGGEAVSAGALPALKQRKAYLGQLRDRAQEAILNAQKLLTLYHEKNKGKGRFVPYTVGQKVWLEGTNLWLAQPSSKLGPRRYGPFVISKVISPVMYRLELPTSWKMFPTFHASLLSPYHEMTEHGANYLEPPPDVIEGQEEYEVEEVLGQRTYGRGKKKQYLIKWKGYSTAHNSWEDASGVHAPELMKEFLQSQRRSAHIATLKAGLGIVQPPMPSGSSAPSLPSPELYSLDHFLWYDGSTRTSPSPEEGEQQPWKTPDDCTDDDASAGESFHTAASRPSSPQRGASGSPDSARGEAVPHPEHLRNASVASPPQDPERRGAPSPLPERAPARN